MIEIGDVFREHSKEYKKHYFLTSHELKVMNAIENCRTSRLGGHVETCDECGQIRISYNSCRNRHCPKCQRIAKEKWLDKRFEDLLPTQYYHLVFTLPSELNNLVLRNKRVMYNLLFKASSETLTELPKDEKYIGAQIGFVSVLHTWGQNLMDHPHVHCIVTGGGLSMDQKRWVEGKKDFFIPVKVLSRMYRGKFLFYLKRLFYNKELMLESDEKNKFLNEIDQLYHKEWVVYCKKPFDNAKRVMSYLGRYTHRIAITNQRIETLSDNKITFKYKDYRDGNKKKHMTLDTTEFIRRFMLHVLPFRFMKIRHYGILSNRNRQTKLKKSKIILNVFDQKQRESLNWQEYLKQRLGIDYSTCPFCGKGKMNKTLKIEPRGSSPPGLLSNIA